MSEGTPLLSPQQRPESAKPLALHEQSAWQVAHFAAFFFGGLFFVVASGAFFINSIWAAWCGGVFFLFGSLSLLAVDVMELHAFRRDEDLYRCLLFNALGSFLYVIGSIGYFPVIDVIVGQLGFILGAPAIFGSFL